MCGATLKAFKEVGGMSRSSGQVRDVKVKVKVKLGGMSRSLGQVRGASLYQNR